MHCTGRVAACTKLRKQTYAIPRERKNATDTRALEQRVLSLGTFELFVVTAKCRQPSEEQTLASQRASEVNGRRKHDAGKYLLLCSPALFE